MEFVADLHLHSRFARATSRQLNPPNLHLWSALKGVEVVGTGDFTHPEWFAELQEHLEPAEAGFYQLREPWRGQVKRALPPACRRRVRFMLTVEISSIYKKNGRTRKIHNIVMLPDFAAVERLNNRLGAIGNLHSDGRPILGLDSRDLLEICLEVCPEVLFVPAHIWTPHFAALGASSGFDSLEECYEDLLDYIFAVETGLSSDPLMNWRLSALDRFAIVSNSDAHSPQKLAREATLFAGAFSYAGIRDALQSRDPARFVGTLEFYPEEGKYHYDGHRKCQVCWKPAQTLAADGLCPVCGRKLTVGVLHRVELLADQPEGRQPQGARPYEYIVPLPEIIGASVGVGPTSKKVDGIYRNLLAELGPELEILRGVAPERIAGLGEPLVAEGVRRMRSGRLKIDPGYDGEYGKVQVFTPEEREKLQGQAALFDMGPLVAEVAAVEPAAAAVAQETTEESPLPAGGGLDPDQRRAATAGVGPVIVIAGPGSGKTRTLTQRIAHLLAAGATPGQVATVTFTNRAAAELRQRLEGLLPAAADLGPMLVGTFHRVALELLRQHDQVLPGVLVDPFEGRNLLGAALAEAGIKSSPARVQEDISAAKAEGLGPEAVEGELGQAYAAYQARLAAHRAWDFDDILLRLLDLLEGDTKVLAAITAQRHYWLVDEFQDVNQVQYRLVRCLAGDGRGLFVIGDPDQAIYGFRGASAGYFDQLHRDFPGAQTVHLATNYRSSQTIVEGAAAVIANNSRHSAVPLRPGRRGGSKLRLIEVPGETGEGIAVVRAISQMVGGVDMNQADDLGGVGGRSFADFAVLYRTTRQAEALEACFIKEGLPYRISGQPSFLEGPGVRPALVFSRLVVDPTQKLRLLQALELEVFKPSAALLATVHQRLATAERLEPEAIAGLGGTPARPLALLADALARYRTLADSASAVEFLQAFRAEFGPAEDVGFERLLGLAANCADLDGLMALLLLGREGEWERAGDQGRLRPEAVRLMTLHGAKGLEFKVVFICGVEAGLLPLGGQGVDIEEERRLFYVGITRAEEELVLLRARRRLVYGRRVEAALSPFVGEIPPPLLVLEKQGDHPPEKRVEQLSLW